MSGRISGQGYIGGLYASLLPSSAPTQASTGFTAWLNQHAGATVTDAATGLQLFCPSAGASDLSASWLVQAAPAAPYKVIALLAVSGKDDSSGSIGWANGTNAAAHLDTLTLNPYQGTNGFKARRFNWSSATAPGAQDTGNIPGQFTWVRLTDDGTNVVIELSPTGDSWITHSTHPKATAYLGAAGYTHLAFGIDPYNSDCIAQLLSWQVSS